MTSIRVLIVVQCLWTSMVYPIQNRSQDFGSGEDPSGYGLDPMLTESPDNDVFLPANNQVPAASTNPWNCQYDSDYCYFISPERATWTDANRKCLELGGGLPSWTQSAAEIQEIVQNNSMWSSLRWYNGRLHNFDRWNTPSVMEFTDLSGPVLHYVAKQQHCFAISMKYNETNNSSPPLSMMDAGFSLYGYACEERLPYFCEIAKRELHKIRKKLALPLETVTDVRLERITTREGKEAIRCSPKFRSRTPQRPSHIVWIMDHMYFSTVENINNYNGQNGSSELNIDNGASGNGEASGSGDLNLDNDLRLENDGSGSESNNSEIDDTQAAVLPLPYESFTSYICEVRYLGLTHGYRSNEIQVSTPSTAKLALVISAEYSLLSVISVNSTRLINEVVSYVNSNSNCKLTSFGKDVYDVVNSQLVWISYFLLQFEENDQRSLRGVVKPCLVGNASLQNTEQYSEHMVHDSVQDIEKLFRGATVKLVAVDWCSAENFTEELAWIGSAGQEVAPTARKPSPTCLDKSGNLVTRTCHGSLISEAKWVEPFSADQNCSQWEPLELPGFCPVGYERKGSGQKGYCVKQVLATSWSDAMATCFGGHQKHPSWSSNHYEAQHWIRSTFDFIKRQDGTSKLVEDLVWLPSRRRIPGGPLYPYFVDPKHIEELSTLNYWEMHLNYNVTSTTSEEIQLDYSDLDSNELCLAWSTKKLKLLTRNCSERYPTVCVKEIAYFNATLNIDPQPPGIYGIQKCDGFDTLLPNELGRRSCYQLIEPSPEESGFTWEEAVAECQKKHPSATLAVMSPNLRSYVLRHLAKRDTNGDLWLGFRQVRPNLTANNECRFVNAKNECIRTPSSVDYVNDFSYGIYASTSQNGSDPFGSSWTLQPPQTLLDGAVCELEYNSTEITPSTYYLTLEWVGDPGDVRISLKYDARPEIEFKRANGRFVRDKLVCFSDGRLLKTQRILLKRRKRETDSSNYFLEMYNFFNATSVHCESMSIDSVFLRSNTLTSLRSDYRFIVALRYRNVTILKELNTNYTPKQEESMNENRDESFLLLNRSSYAKKFEPSVMEGSPFNQSLDLYTKMFRGMFHENYSNLDFVVTHIQFDRVATNMPEKENLVVRYHVTVKNTTKSTFSQEKVYTILSSTFSAIDGNISMEKIQSSVVCLPDSVAVKNVGSLTWPETRLHKTVFSREGCILEGGSLVQRTCNGDAYFGAEWGPMQAWNRNGVLENLPADFVCSEPSKTTAQLINMFQSSTNATSVLDGLQNVTKAWEPSLADIQLTSYILLDAANKELNFSNKDVNRTTSIIQQVLNVDTETLANAQKIPSVSTSLLAGLEEILTRTESVNLTLSTPRFDARVMPIQKASSLFFGGSTNQLGEGEDTINRTAITPSPSAENTTNYDVAVVLNASSLPKLPEGHSSLTFIFHPNIRLVNAAAAERKQTVHVFSTYPSDGDTEALHPQNCSPNSALVQVGLKGGALNLVHPVSLYFRPFKLANTSNSRVSILCAFWNPQSNAGAGGWSTDGCWYLGNENGLDHCQCNHFSAFITLYAYDGEIDQGIHGAILDFITMLGCSLSLLGLVGIMATYVLFPQWRKVSSHVWGHHVTFNLSLALALLLAVFLGGLERTEDPLVCLLIAALLHYLMLATFCWMLVEAYCHHLLFVKVFDTYVRRFIWKACLFAWLTPAVPVLLTTVLKKDLYYYKDSNRYCWLTPQGFYYTLLPLVGLISVINLVTYVRILVSVMCSKSVAQTNKNRNSVTLRQLNMAIATFVLMGLSWVFGLLAFGQARTLFSYLFCVFASLQGAAMFWFFVFREKRTQELWANFIRNISAREQARQKRQEMVRGNCQDTSDSARPKYSTSKSSNQTNLLQSQSDQYEYETSCL